MRLSAPIADWRLERFLLRELPEAELEQIEVLLSQDEALRLRLDALRVEDDAVRERYPAAWMARQIETRRDAFGAQASDSQDWSVWWRWSPAVAIVLTLAALPILRSTNQRATNSLSSPVTLEQTRLEPVRIKGDDVRLVLHRKAGEGSQLLDHMETVASGDLVMIEYQASGASHGLIVSIDGSGVISRHYPLDGRHAAPLGTGLTSLSHAYELDDAPRWETFYLVTGDRAFEIDVVIGALESMPVGSDPPGDLPLSAEFGQSHRTLLKQEEGR